MDGRLELTARRIIATSIAYYGLDVSLVEDTQFDQWCRQVSDRWDDLEEITKWKLGTPEEIRASGFHVKMRQMDLMATRMWIASKNMLRNGLITDPKRWLPLPKWVVKLDPPRVAGDPEDFMFMRWTTVDNIGWNLKETIQ